MLSKNDLLSIGLSKRNGEVNTSWNELAKQFGEGYFADGEAFRCWVKNQVNSKRSQGKIEADSNEKPANSLIYNGSAKDEKNEAKNYKETIEINKDGSQNSDKLLEMSKEQCKDVNYLLNAHGYDPDAWELISARNNFWNVYSKQDGVQTLYSSKISVKPLVKDGFDKESIQNWITQLMVDFKPKVHVPLNYKRFGKVSEDGKTLEIEMSDLHVGKLASVSDTGEKYNKEIARERFFYILNDIIIKTQNYYISKILFVYSHDFFHVDGFNKSTTGGTPQDLDGNYQDMFRFGNEMLIEGIELLSQVAPVETILVGANHDRMSSYTSSEVLYAWFRNIENVTIDRDFLIRKYKFFGKNLVGFSHGHSEKSRIAEVMQVEARKYWGEAKFCEFHCGHFHSERTIEKGGLTVRYLGSPSGTDKWHKESGYVGSIKKATAFIWDNDKGVENIIYSVVE